MDFVVIGLGLSALALLTGLALLCMVAPRWSRRSRAVQPADAAYARALAGTRHALGQGFLCVGAVLLLATLGGISAGLADKAGAYLIAAMTTVAALGLFGWDILYRRQHPVPHRRRAAPARAKSAVAEASSALSEASAGASPPATTTAVRRRVLPARHHAAPAKQPAAAVAADTADIAIDAECASADLEPQAEARAAAVDVAEPQAEASDEPESVEESRESETKPGPTDGLPAEVTAEPGEMVTEENEVVAGEPAEGATELPEPVPFAPAHANGTTRPITAPETGDEPESIPDGDDRVIALFPTAAARRSRMMAAPTDPDGQN